MRVDMVGNLRILPGQVRKDKPVTDESEGAMRSMAKSTISSIPPSAKRYSSRRCKGDMRVKLVYEGSEEERAQNHLPHYHLPHLDTLRYLYIRFHFYRQKRRRSLGLCHVRIQRR